MAALDPDASVILILMDRALADQQTIAAQREALAAMSALAAAQDRAVRALTGLADLLAARAALPPGGADA